MTINEDLNPYPLSDGDIVPGWISTSFSKEAAIQIRNTLRTMGIKKQTIAESTFLGKDTIEGALRTNQYDPKPLRNENFKILLKFLVNHGVIKLPEGQTPETLLEMSIEPYTLSKKDIVFKKNNVSLLGADPKEIQRFITQNGLNQKITSERCGLKYTYIVQIFSERSFCSKKKFKECLTALIENNFIQLPKGQTLETLLENPTEPSTPSRVDIKSRKRQPLKAYTLSDADIVFDREQISLSKAAAETIQSYIKKRQLRETLVQQLYVENSLPKNSLPSILDKVPLYGQTLEIILTVLLKNGVITLPEGETLENLLSTDQEPLHTPTEATLDISQNCAAVGGGGDSSTHSPLTTLHSAHIANNKGR